MTSLVNLESISRNGLMPAIGPRSADAGESAPAVYLFKDIETMETALLNWLGDLLDEEEIALIAVDLVLGPEQGSFTRSEQPPPPAHCSVLGDDPCDEPQMFEIAVHEPIEAHRLTVLGVNIEEWIDLGNEVLFSLERSDLARARDPDAWTMESPLQRFERAADAIRQDASTRPRNAPRA